MRALIGKEKLTDGSFVFYVLCAEESSILKFDCVTESDAEKLLITIKNTTINCATY